MTVMIRDCRWGKKLHVAYCTVCGDSSKAMEWAGCEGWRNEHYREHPDHQGGGT